MPSRLYLEDGIGCVRPTDDLQHALSGKCLHSFQLVSTAPPSIDPQV